MEGQTINIMLGPPIDDISSFCESVFSSSEPFRLWGVPIQLSANFYRVQAFDIHIGGTIWCLKFRLILFVFTYQLVHVETALLDFIQICNIIMILSSKH